MITIIALDKLDYYNNKFKSLVENPTNDFNSRYNIKFLAGDEKLLEKLRVYNAKKILSTEDKIFGEFLKNYINKNTSYPIFICDPTEDIIQDYFLILGPDVCE